jgi:hypothetical protein
VFICVISRNLNVSRNVFFLCSYVWPIETASLLGMKMFCCHFLRGRGGCWVFGRVCTRWVCLQVIAEEMKIYSYIHVGGKKIHIHQMFPNAWSNSNYLYSRIYLMWHQQDWRGAGLLNFPFVIKQ